VAAEVRDFYEHYPYPRPVESLEQYRKRWQDPHRRRADYHLFWPVRPYREDPAILVAGCGTSQAAKHAMRWPEAQVTGIDFSATSVSCTEALKQKYNLDNLQLHQLPIERVSELGTNFDQIVCTGVLHHLSDPDAGLKALRDVLKPDGAMHLMVYAPYGRAGIYLIQDFCKRLGIQPTDEDIRDLISALRGLPLGHPLESLLRQAPDFREPAALADALLHPQDRAYSVPQFFDFIQRGGLTFGRWLKQAPYSAHCGVLAQIPQTARMAMLTRPEQYAAVELFRGTMVCHSAIVYRDDDPGGSQRLDFFGDAWLDYVPLRVPDTVCVEEHLPPGAAAVLINPAHTYRDLILPIDSDQKRWFDAIDGKRSIGAIVKRAFASEPTPAQMNRVHTFFGQLEEYDQVVFNTKTERTKI